MVGAALQAIYTQEIVPKLQTVDQKSIVYTNQGNRKTEMGKGERACDASNLHSQFLHSGIRTTIIFHYFQPKIKQEKKTTGKGENENDLASTTAQRNQ